MYVRGVDSALYSQSEGRGFNTALGRFVYAGETYLTPYYQNTFRCI